MNVLLIASAVLILSFGHWIKARRWSVILSVFEPAGVSRLLGCMAVGQAVNMVVPFRLGDLLRTYLAGKQLKNGFVLALASVAADIFTDLVTVGLAFVTLFALGIHRDIVGGMALRYGLLSFCAVAAALVVFLNKRRVKAMTQRFSALFNPQIEQRILIASYTALTSVKDMLRRKNLLRMLALTAGVWLCYFLAYDIFALFLQRMGYDFTLTGVFSTIFSMSGSSLLLELLRSQRTMRWLLWFLVFLCVPMLLLSAASLLGGGKRSDERHSILPQMKEADRLAFLKLYFTDRDPEYIQRYLSINQDVSVLEDRSAGSDATTLLCMKDGEMFYRKYALGDAAAKLAGQIRWLEAHGSLPLPAVLRKTAESDYCYYDMPYFGDAEDFFQFIHTMPVDRSWEVLTQILDTLERELYSDGVPAEKAAIDAYIREKVTRNLETLDRWGAAYYGALYASGTVIVNGREMPGIGHYRAMLSGETLSRVFRNDEVCEIHGDLTVENIICRSGRTDGWYLIDPNPGGAFQTPYMDLGKLLQSLHGKYEFLSSVTNVRTEGNRIDFPADDSAAYRELYLRYRGYLEERYSGEGLRSIYCHEAVHWLRLMPYRIRSNPRLAVVHFVGMLAVLADVEEILKDGK